MVVLAAEFHEVLETADFFRNGRKFIVRHYFEITVSRVNQMTIQIKINNAAQLKEKAKDKRKMT